jgi:hypothetical protein
MLFLFQEFSYLSIKFHLEKYLLTMGKILGFRLFVVCYDNYVWWFWPMFGKNGVFLCTNLMSWSFFGMKNCTSGQNFRQFFGESILKIHNIAPRTPTPCATPVTATSYWPSATRPRLRARTTKSRRRPRPPSGCTSQTSPSGSGTRTSEPCLV